MDFCAQNVDRKRAIEGVQKVAVIESAAMTFTNWIQEEIKQFHLESPHWEMPCYAEALEAV